MNFIKTAISFISIPLSVTNIGEEAFTNCFYLLIFEISDESKLKSTPISDFKGCAELLLMISSSN